MSNKVIAVKLKPYLTPHGRIPNCYELGTHEFNGAITSMGVDMRSECNGFTLELSNIHPVGAPELVCAFCEEEIQLPRPNHEVLTFWALMTCQFRFPRGNTESLKRIPLENQQQLDRLQPDNPPYTAVSGKRTVGYMYRNWLQSGINLLVTGLDTSDPYDENWEQLAYWEVIRALTSIHSASIKEFARQANSVFGWLYPR